MLLKQQIMAVTPNNAEQIIDIAKTVAVYFLGDTDFPVCIDFIEVIKNSGTTFFGDTDFPVCINFIEVLK